jgi:hypothetical protein
MEAESEPTITQLKEKRQSELAAREVEEVEYQWQKEELAKQEEDQGIDWGMGEFRFKPQLSDMFQSVKWIGHELHQAHETVLLLFTEDMDTSYLGIVCFTICCQLVVIVTKLMQMIKAYL